MSESATMHWTHKRHASRIVVFDIEGDEAAFQHFMERLSTGLVWDEHETLQLPLERYFKRKLDITKVPMGGPERDDRYEVRPIEPGMRHAVGAGSEAGETFRRPARSPEARMNALERAAHHEAAHAVVADSLGWTVTRVQVRRWRDGSTGGLTKKLPSFTALRRRGPGGEGAGRLRTSLRRVITENACIGLAGVAAERRLPNADAHEIAAASLWDLNGARETVAAIAPRTVDRILRRQARAAERILESRWGDVERLAALVVERRRLVDRSAIRRAMGRFA